MRIGFYGTVALALVAMAEPAICQVPLNQSGMRGKIEIQAVDCFGNELPDATITVRYLDNVRPSTEKVLDRLTGPLEYGRYRIMVENPNFEPASKDVFLGGPRAIVLIGLVPTAIESTNLVMITGLLKDPVTTDCRLMRLIPLFTTVPPSDAVVYNNRFTVADVKPGKYATVLVGSKGICRTSQITVWLGTTNQSIALQ